LHGWIFWSGLIELGGWGIALVWVLRTYDALQGLPTVTRLSGTDWDVEPVGEPTLTVVLAAKDEAKDIAATMDALLAADYPRLRIVVVDDRSTDGTGAILDEYAARAGAEKRPRVEVIHLAELPEGWLGKTFALMVGTERVAAQGGSDYVLYTDADVLLSPSILRRAVAFAEATEADHLVVMPTFLVKGRSEGIVLGFLQVMGLWASRPWKIDDPKATRDVIGVGSFNLVRLGALEEIGGWEPQRLAVIEDVALGRRMKAAGMRQRIAFAPGFVLVHWAKGARGILRGMTKNFFAAFGFRLWLLLPACLWIVVFWLVPIAGLGWWRTLLPAVLVLICIAALYRKLSEVSMIDARYGWVYPLGAVGVMYAMLRSMVVVIWEGGVTWRGTHYRLRDLRRHNSPFVWEREARQRRDEQVRAEKMVRRAKKKSGS
jgi:glycosyltransferase involved in cell wall biosynthesis